MRSAASAADRRRLRAVVNACVRSLTPLSAVSSRRRPKTAQSIAKLLSLTNSTMQ